MLSQLAAVVTHQMPLYNMECDERISWCWGTQALDKYWSDPVEGAHAFFPVTISVSRIVGQSARTPYAGRECVNYGEFVACQM